LEDRDSCGEECDDKEDSEGPPDNGRVAGDLEEGAQIFYQAIQVADIFYMGVDICQLGLDQRRAIIPARGSPEAGLQENCRRPPLHVDGLARTTGHQGIRGGCENESPDSLKDEQEHPRRSASKSMTIPR